MKNQSQASHEGQGDCVNSVKWLKVKEIWWTDGTVIIEGEYLLILVC